MTLNAKYTKKQYFNPYLPGSYSAFHGFWKNRDLKDLKRVKQNLEEIKTYTLHAPIRRKFRRLSVRCNSLDLQWICDLIDCQLDESQNDHFRYILVVVDCLSKMLFTEPLKNKKAVTVTEAFRKIFKRTRRRPLKIQSDFGTEFENVIFKDFLKKNNITLFHTYSRTKANIVERKIEHIRSILARVFTHFKNRRWIDILPILTKTINNTFHRSIGRTPQSVTKKNQDEVLMKLYQHLVELPKKKPKFKTGDLVRSSKFKKNFEKG